MLSLATSLGAAALIAGALDWDARTEPVISATVQYALENLVSGSGATAELGGTTIEVTPLRTWKSVTGHWCRRYAVVITPRDTEETSAEATRCRVNGVWMNPAADSESSDRTSAKLSQEGASVTHPE